MNMGLFGDVSGYHLRASLLEHRSYTWKLSNLQRVLNAPVHAGGVIEKAQSPTRPRCRIPQRLGSPVQKVPPSRPVNSPAVTQNARTPRSLRSESRSRSSANRSDTASVKHSAQAHVTRAGRPERLQPAQTKKYPVHKKVFNSYSSKLRVQNFSKLPRLRMDPGMLPDQETILKREKQELEKGYQDAEEVADVVKIQQAWKKNLSQFEALKRDLDVQQKNIMELYAALRHTHKAMSALGQNVNLPSVEDLRIMNVAKLTPEQLLQLCTDSHDAEELLRSPKIATIDLNKFFEMPTKLVATCEMTLHKRMEIIDWFQSLKSEEKGISMNKLTKKINEFTAENEMLNCSLNNCKADFMKELRGVFDSLRSGVKETVTLQVRIEEMTYEISDLNTQNADLRKQLQVLENMKSTQNKLKFEELEKELKEEKCKKAVIKDRLMRAEGQVKILNEQGTQLKSALELARSQNWTLERTVQQLNEQNQKLQSDFDKELIKLTNSIKDNTCHLEEIAEAREKLQLEKEALERRLQELSDSYNESLNKLNDEHSKNVKKLKETEDKFEAETKERKKLESKLESLCAQIFEAEIRYKDGLKQMQAKDEELSKFLIVKCELESTKKSLEEAKSELEDYKERMQIQTKTIQENERKFQETVLLDKSLKTELRNKEKYISELEKNQALLEQQLHEGEHKMESYEKQLNSLKTEIAQVHEEFGEFDNMSQLHDMINEQRENLLDITRQNGELTNALQQKDLELENQLQQLAEQQQLLEQKDDNIKMITEKEEEQANIIKLLRNNLEIRTKADAELNQQLTEKNTEIESLVTNVETRKQQISQLEQIILTLEDQLRRVNLQRRRDQDKMTMLEKALIDYETMPESKHYMDAPVDNLDNLIKILEDELSTSFDPIQNKPPVRRKVIDERKKYERIEHCVDGRIDDLMHAIEEDKPAPKNHKKYVQGMRDKDYLGRKQAITNMETQKWLANTQPINMYSATLEKKNPPLKGTVPVVQVIAGQLDDKKGKMLKLAGHNL